MVALALNTKGQCPACRIKPLVYKRRSFKFCHRCSRAFNINTGEQIENWAYRIIDGEMRHVNSRGEAYPNG